MNVVVLLIFIDQEHLKIFVVKIFPIKVQMIRGYRHTMINYTVFKKLKIISLCCCIVFVKYYGLGNNLQSKLIAFCFPQLDKCDVLLYKSYNGAISL